jgi:flagellar biosynthesis chaperone FliJ
MTAQPVYPLEQLLTVKKERVNKAEKIVQEKRRALEIEVEKLKKVEAERDRVLKHHDEKLSQLRISLDEGTTSPEILQMKAYLKVVKGQLVKEEEKVKKQKDQVATAQKNLEVAQEELQRKRVELEKIKMHKEEWIKDTKIEMLKEESKEMDEIGNLTHQAEKRKRNRS